MAAVEAALSLDAPGPPAFSIATAAPPAFAETVHRPGTFGAIYETSTRNFTRTFIKGGKSGANIDDGAPLEGLTINTASFTLANSIVGAGLVGLCFVANSAGIVPFMLFVTCAGYGMTRTLDMLAAGAEMAGFKHYERIGIAAVGTCGKWASSLMICVQCYGSLTAYMVLIAGTAPVIGVILGFNIEAVYLQIGIALVIVLPMTMLKDMSSLAFSAKFALVAYLAVALYTVGRGFTDTWYTDVGVPTGVEFPPGSGEFKKACPVEGIKWVESNPVGIVKNLPTIIFAYVCHQTALSVFTELNGGQVKDMNTVNRTSISIAGFLYCCVGLFGYIAYTNNTFSSVLLNLRHCVCAGDEPCESGCKEQVCADDDIIASFLNFAFLFAVITGYPSVHFALRRSLITMFWGEGQPFSMTIHCGIALANVFVTTLVAIVAKDVSVVFNWAGSISSPMVSICLPSFFFLVLFKQNKMVFDTVGPRWARSLLGVGVCMMTVGIFLNFANTIGWDL